MARGFTKVSEEEIEEAFFYPSDLVNTKTTIPLRVGEERWIYTSTLRVSVYIHHYSPPLRGIVVYYYMANPCALIGSFSVRILQYGPFPWKQSNPCIFVLERSRQIQNLKPKQQKKV